MPKVLNKRTDTIPPDAVYVGRPSKWGNPFRLQNFCSRQQLIEVYEKWIADEIQLGNLNLSELRGKDLVCWCAPLPCHADVLLGLANK